MHVFSFTLDKDQLSNHRPISNHLTFLSYPN